MHKKTNIFLFNRKKHDLSIFFVKKIFVQYTKKTQFYFKLVLYYRLFKRNCIECSNVISYEI